MEEPEPITVIDIVTLAPHELAFSTENGAENWNNLSLVLEHQWIFKGILSRGFEGWSTVISHLKSINNHSIASSFLSCKNSKQIWIIAQILTNFPANMDILYNGRKTSKVISKPMLISNWIKYLLFHFHFHF